MIEQVGRLHPLLIHLPIGVLIFALMITILPAKQREILAPALKLALIITALSSLAACVAGYLLGQSGDYEEALVQNHQWLGIGTCVMAIATLLIKPYKRQMVWLTVIVMTFASHMGGTITHGEGYLFSSSSKEKTEPADSALSGSTVFDSTVLAVNDTSSVTAAAPKQVFLYRDEITPILKNKCYSCHSAVKKKGGLRLDGEAFITKGGKNGSILKKGDPNNSIIYTQLLLPLEDEKHMPPKGKKQLTKNEIALIHRWIAKGAPYVPIDVAPMATAAALPTAAIEAEITAPAEEPRQAPPAKAEQPFKSIPAGNESSIQTLKQQGILVEPLVAGSNGLTVNFVNVKELDPAMFAALNDLNKQIVELKLTGQPVTDDQLAGLSSFENLSKLQLDRTAITDKGLGSLKKFPALESLNLYGTAVSDNGMGSVSSCKNLKRIYLWKTGVTEQGLKNLHTHHPSLKTDAGLNTLVKPDSTKKN